MTAPSHLRVEHLDHPLGIDVRSPRLSWRLPSGARTQLAYQLRAGEWDSGRVASGQSLLVPYSGPPLKSGERVEWTAKVWTDTGESDWAEPAWWEMGLLSPADWFARWVTWDDALTSGTPDPHPARLLRGTCEIDVAVASARLYVTAQGLYEFFINGNRVGNMELTPGFTSYSSVLQVQTFDVTSLLRAGQNVLGAVLTGGWLKWTRRFRHTPVALLAQLHVHGADGSLTRVGTGADWLTTTGAIKTADLWQGQVVDLRAEPAGWSEPNAEPEGWTPARVEDYDLERLCSSPAPPVRRVEHRRAVGITRPKSDSQVIDLGQNINGWIRLKNLGTSGTALTLTHGEALGADGDVTLDHIMGGEPEDDKPFQRDEVIASGRGNETFEPRHTTHGFRYVRVEGHPGDLGVDDIDAMVVHTDMRRTGWFECSDERINKLHEAAVWSFRGNACDIPTDCPTRERAGWTGDWQLFVPTAAFLYDVAGFSTKWLRDLAADQLPNGVVWHCAPNAERADFYRDFPPGSAGWGDAAVIVPWEIYRAYGDLNLLNRQWGSMTAWVEYAARVAREHRHPSRMARRPTPAPHEQFLWDTGFHWGEWLEPESLAQAEPDRDAGSVEALLEGLHAADHGNLATAYLHLSSKLLARIATVIGRPEAAARYQNLASSTRAAWQVEFLGADGRVVPETQANYVRALAFDLVSDDLRPRAAEHLANLIRKADTHLGTGFLATPLLLPTLADNGYTDLAYELLFQDTEPSWLTMINRGATTIWEHWSGIDADGLPSNSLNHYSKGAVASFLHRYVGGLQLMDDAPAYRRFRVAPRPGGGITYARATHDSPYGRIEAAWHLDGNLLTLDVTAPPGTTAEVCLPSGQVHVMQSARSHYTDTLTLARSGR